MAQVVAYRQDQRLAPVAGEKQRAVSAGFGQDIGDGLQAAARGVGQLAQGVETFNEKIDVAAVRELDGLLGQEERRIRTQVGSALGRNAQDAADTAQQEWMTTRDTYLGRVSSANQRALLERVLDSRGERLADFTSGHVAREMTAYVDQQETANIANLGVEVSSLMPGDPDRRVAMDALAMAHREMVARKGLSAETGEAVWRETTTGVHTTTINAMMEAGGENVLWAESYLNSVINEIDPDKRAALRQNVREQGMYVRASTAAETLDFTGPAAVVPADAAAGRPAPFTLGRPVTGEMRVISGVGERWGRNHNGVDIPKPVGSPVVAAGPGVVRVRNDPDGYGRWVEIDHGGGYTTRYAHLSAANVQDGQHVDAGAVIALSGGARNADGSGNSHGPHVHYEVRHNGAVEDPEAMTGREVAGAVVPGSPRPGVGMTREDVLDRARAAAERDYPGDPRAVERYRQVALTRYGDHESNRADSEQQVAREAERYLPGGPNEVSSYEQMPLRIRQDASYAQQRSWANTFEADAKEGSSVPTTVSDDTRSNWLDAAMGSPQRQAEFLAQDFTILRGSTLSAGDADYLRNLQRTMRVQQGAARPGQADLVSRSLTMTAPLRQQYYTAAGITTGNRAEDEDRSRKVQFDAGLTDAVTAFVRDNGKQPTPQEVDGMMAVLAQRVQIQVDDDRNPATPMVGQNVRLFEATGQYRAVIPAADRADVVRRLQAMGRPTTSQNVQNLYNLGLGQGVYTAPRDD